MGQRRSRPWLGLLLLLALVSAVIGQKGKDKDSVQATTAAPITTAPPAANIDPAVTTVPAANTDQAATTVPAVNTDQGATTVPAANTDQAATTVPAANTDQAAAPAPTTNTDQAAVPVPAANTDQAAAPAPTTNTDQAAVPASAVSTDQAVAPAPTANTDQAATTAPAANIGQDVTNPLGAATTQAVTVPEAVTTGRVTMPGTQAGPIAEAVTRAQATSDSQATTAGAEASQPLWAKLTCEMRMSTKYQQWMADNSTDEYQQLASDVTNAVTPELTDKFQDTLVSVSIDGFSDLDPKTVYVTFYIVVKTGETREKDVDKDRLIARTRDALEEVKEVGDFRVRRADVSKEVEFIEPNVTTAPTESTVRDTELTDTTPRKKRATTVTDTAVRSTESSGEAAGTTTTVPPRAAPAASSAGGRTSSATPATTAANTATAEANTTNTTTAGANTTEAAANTTMAVANTTMAAANTTEAAANTTTVAPTTTTEAPQPVSARLSCQVSITSMEFQPWMKLSFTDQYQWLVDVVKKEVTPALEDKFGDAFTRVDVTGFEAGSVVASLDVTVKTNETRSEDIDTATLTSDTAKALQTVVDSADGQTFDPSAVQVSDEIQVIEATTTPAPTDDPYQFTLIRFVMRAPNANWTDEMNDTESAIFKEMDKDVDKGVKEMLSKKYPEGEWNVSAAMISMWNDTTATQEGMWINFLVSVEPQMRNTTSIVTELGKAYVYFNRLGELQIDPASVSVKDMTTYAPALGVVLMDSDYLRELRKSRYNGSYVGDYTTQPPTLRPVVKRDKGYILGIAVPAFLGMLAGIGLLLICTTIAGAKKSDD